MTRKADPNKEVNPDELPPPETAMTESEAAYSGDPAADLDDIEVREPGSADTAASGDAGHGDPEMDGVTVPGDAMPFEEWYQEAFIGTHQMANVVLRTQSLREAPAAPEGRRAALGMYRTCCRVPALHFILRPGPAWMRDLGAIAFYAYFTGLGVAAELADRKAAAAKAKTAGASTTGKPGGAAAGQHDFAAKAA